MDWTYKHFKQQAIYSATASAVLDAARGVMKERLGAVEDTPDGLVARGEIAWRPATATFHTSSVPDGTQLSVEVVARRRSFGGYMLWDVGNIYNSRIDDWFQAIGQRLGTPDEQAIVSKTTSSLRIQRGCLAGCLVWFALAACLGTVATGLDGHYFPKTVAAGALPGPFMSVASAIAMLGGIAVFLYFFNPKSSFTRSIRARLKRSNDKGM